MNTKNVRKSLIIASVVLCAAGIAWPQTEESGERIRERQKLIRDEETRQLAKTEKPPEKKANFTFNYGGWANFTHEEYQDIDKNDNVEDWVKEDYYIDTRVWLLTTYYQTLTFYGRMGVFYIWRPEVSSDYTGIGDDCYGPTADMLYVDIDLRDRFHVPISMTTGRQFFTVGRGITYSNVHDGMQWVLNIGRSFVAKFFISQTKRFEYNIDYSVPNYKKQNNRQFYGAEMVYLTRYAAFYTYGLIQRDLTQERPEDIFQNYTYNSEYIGWGVSGSDIKGFSYWGELIKEYGTSNTDATRTSFDVKPVDAWAFDAGVKYKFNCYSHPTIEAEMAYGSGDKDRARVTNTIGGNVNSTDTNFLYFGVFNAGYTLVPRLSNIYIYKIEGSCKPFEFVPYIGKNIAVGAKFYVYRKDQKQAGIYDIYATNANFDIGKEVDGFLHWKVYENFFFTIRYGMFFPGDAYPESRKHNSQYLYLRTLFTF